MTRYLIMILIMFASLNVSVGQDKYAVVVGVETYDTSIFNNLNYAQEDANELASSLQALGFQVSVLTQDASTTRLRPTTPKKILDRLRTISASCDNGDTLLISFSGHGVQFADEELGNNGVRETYLCPADADLNDKSTLLKSSEVMEILGRSSATRKLFLVDACRENIQSTDAQRKSSRRIELGSVHENRRSVPGGMAVLFSCSSRQFSWEHKDLQHSVFSNFVIRYLNGHAEDRFYTDGAIDIDGWMIFEGRHWHRLDKSQ